MLSGARIAGFTLIELMVTIAVFSILVLVGAPAFQSWVANAQVRTVADGLLNGLHLAQAEATRRNRQIQFVLTNSDPSSASPTPSSSGQNWVLLTVPLLSDSTGTAESAERIQGGALGNVASAVAVQVSPSTSSTLTFNSFGLVSGATGTTTYAVTRSNADHPLNVTVSVGGQLRVCDAGKTLANSPEGC